jgi:glutathione peroxidase
MKSDFYSFDATALNKENISMSRYEGKVMLVVNTASKCGFTPQYEGLQKIYDKYRDEGFEVLGFPCNQFANQEPGDEKEIAEGCLINYGVTFQMFSKIKVNGKETHPIFKFLKEALGGFLTKDIKWNFTKFLIDRNGNPVKRYAPKTKPEQLEKDIMKLL